MSAIRVFKQISELLDTSFNGVANDDFLQRKAGAWSNRTIAQVKSDLGLTGTNSGDQTITLTGDVTGSGTGSFAATLAGTAAISGQRHSIRIAQAAASLWQTAVSGAGTATTNGYGRLISSGATTGAARVAWNNGGINNNGYSFHHIAGIDNRSIPWGRVVECTVNVQLTAFNATTNGYCRIYCGVGAVIGSVLSGKGMGIHVTAARAILLVAHDGSTLTTSASLGTLAISSVYHVQFRLRSDGAGNVSLWQDDVLLGTITGGPVTTGSQNACGIHVEVGNGGDAAAVTMTVGDFVLGVF